MNRIGSPEQPAHQPQQISIPQAMRIAFEMFSSGRLNEAATLYQQILQVNPAESDALHFLGLIAAQSGNLNLAVDLIAKAIEHNGNKPEYFNNLGNAYSETGRDAEAIECYRRAIRLNPNFAEPCYNLGRSLQKVGQLDDALQMYDRALKARPKYLEAISHKACLLNEMGRLEDALLWCKKILELQPNHFETYYNMGVIHEVAGRVQDASACYRRALEINPDYVNALNNLGVLYKNDGNFHDAVSCYQKALQLQPGCEDALINLGIVHLELSNFQTALDCFDAVLAVSPGNVLALHNRGIALQGLERHGDAIDSLEKALSLDAKFMDAYLVLAGIYFIQGRHEEACELYRKICIEKPLEEKAAHALLFSLNYAMNISPDAVYKEHRRFGEQLEATRMRIVQFANSLEPQRRLRVGYVSGDFKKHSVSFFLEPVLAQHDRHQYEICCYANLPLVDTVTERLKSYADKWQNIYNKSDDDVAMMVRRDAIDILVDLSGHTAGNALKVFARHPAPVQVSWLGYLTTTGLSAIDYRIVDSFTDPEGTSECYHTETLWRMPHGFVVYQPLPQAPDVGPLPALTNGCITFGSFNNYAKVTPQVISLWAEVLKAVPTSRLLLKSAGLGEPRVRQRIVSAFSACGIGTERLDLRGRDESHHAHLERFNEMDIALDTFPCNGGTTTCDGLWMGVPAITLAGDRFISRMGVSMAHNAGLADWVAQTPEEYVALAQYWAEHLQELSALRARLRQQVAASPLMNAECFTRNLENAYRTMWQRYVTGAVDAASGKDSE